MDQQISLHKKHTNLDQEEHRFFRGDKGFHFFNNLGLVDVSGLFLHYKPGFAGQLADTTCYNNSELVKLLTENNVDTLADGVFGSSDHLISIANVTNQRMHQSSIHKANHARVENTFQEMHAQQKSSSHVWRHSRALYPSAHHLGASLFNFKKQKRLMKGLELFEQTVSATQQ